MPATQLPSINMFFHFVTLTFDLILIGGRGIMMDYPCTKFGDFSFSHFGFIMDKWNQTHADEDDCYTRYRLRE